jgi:hypothetical protein
MFRDAVTFYAYCIKNTVEKDSYKDKYNSIFINNNFQNEDMRR